MHTRDKARAAVHNNRRIRCPSLVGWRAVFVGQGAATVEFAGMYDGRVEPRQMKGRR
jgi:hypothetical protein